VTEIASATTHGSATHVLDVTDKAPFVHKTDTVPEKPVTTSEQSMSAVPAWSTSAANVAVSDEPPTVVSTVSPAWQMSLQVWESTDGAPAKQLSVMVPE